jgi:hypothetical protein
MSPRPTPRTAAILTGDLIGSTEASPAALERAMEVLAHAAGEISSWTRGADTRFTRYRGDGWQIHLAEPGLALRAALVLAARLRAADTGLATRAAIGIGPVEGLGTDSLADARGPAFEASGHALDRMRHGRRLAIDGERVTTLHRIIVELLDEWAKHWTAEQAEATALYLHPDNPTLADIAPRLAISPQAVNYRLSGAGGPAIRRALRAWEDDWEFAGEAAGSAA